MKTVIINIIYTLCSFLKAHTVVSIATAAAVVTIAVATPVAVHVIREKQESAPEVSQDEPSINESTTPEQNETEDPVEETPEVVEPESEKKEKEEKTEEKKEDKKDTSSTSDKNNTSNSNKTENTNSTSDKEEEKNSSTPNSSISKKESWLDTSGLTFTEADVGKIVGYDSSLNKDIVITRIEQGTRNGLQYIILYPSNGIVSNEFTKVECTYCHSFPCPKGGGENCPQYNIKEDPSETCQRCGRPCGDGYNGTCDGQIDWDNGGKVTCNHYD